jgi:hypothetical protein
MDFDLSLSQLDDLLIDLLRRVNGFCKEVAGQQFVDWNALQWSSKGAANLFEEFRRAGAWADSITSRTLDFEQEKNGIACAFRNLKVQLEEKVEKTLQANVKSWVMQGYAQQERQSLARIEVGDAIYNMNRVDNRISDIEVMIGVLKAKSQQLTAFKNDARAATALMNFGNQLGELK